MERVNLDSRERPLPENTMPAQPANPNTEERDMQLSKMKMNNEKGFTLVELMIVVAIIGILAAIAIPQFAAYRQRAFNTSAQSDVRNTKTAQEVLQADHQVYGTSDEAQLNAGGAGGAGVELAGPLSPASMTVVGGALLATNTVGDPVGVGIGVGNGVYLLAETEGAALYGSFIITARHNNGPRAYATDSDSTAIYYVDDPGLIGTGALTVTPVAPSVGVDDLTGVPAGGLTADAITSTWTAQ
jgi:type IV pilus assembly protein PilA